MSPQTYGMSDFRGAYSTYRKFQLMRQAIREHMSRYSLSPFDGVIGYDRNVSKEYQEQSAKARRAGE